MTHVAQWLTLVCRLAGKEWLLLVRNPHGLAVLFLMPAVFVLIMSFTLKNTLVVRVEMPTTGWVLEDDSPLVVKWAQEWHELHGGIIYASREALQTALKQKEVQAGVISLKPWVGTDGLPLNKQTQIWLTDKVQPAAAARLRVELTFSILKVKMKIAAAQAGPFASILLSRDETSQLLGEDDAPEIRYLYEIQSGRKLTAVQQSVPAWLIFGMFFVVIPIAGVLIQERNDGTLARLASFGVTPVTILGGKLLAFMALNWIQLIFMLVVGHWVVPLLGGDTLYLSISVGWFVLMVLATSAAAVSLALLIAAMTRSFDHAAALGSGLNVIMGAIAGVMVPRMLMPSNLQVVSEWSPMGWALDGMQAVFLGTPDAAFMLPRIALLLSFAASCCIASWWRLRLRA
jgi:ABC-2 type transport system permease protein